jgi:hypothetical protein
MTRLAEHGVRRFTWLVSTACLAALGLVAAVVFVPLSTILAVFLLAAGVAGSAYLSVALINESLNCSLLVEVCSWAGRAGVGGLVICGYGSSVGLAALPLAGLVVLSSPLAFSRRDASPERSRRPATSQPEVLEVDVASLTDEELCTAWRRSSSALCDRRGVDALQAVVDTRRRYLDELERRRPDAFAQWLRTWPGGVGDPSRYYTGANSSQPPGDPE